MPPVPPVKDSLDHERLIPASKEVRINSLSSPVLKDARVPPLTKMPTISPPVDKVHPALRGAPSSISVAPSSVTVGSNADLDGRRSLQGLSEKILGRALKECDPAKKERLLSFAKVNSMVVPCAGVSLLISHPGSERLFNQCPRSPDQRRNCADR